MDKESKKRYKKELLRPEWQKKRLEILQRDDFTCAACEATDRTLHVHHKYYEKGKKAWEYPDNAFETLCWSCHSKQPKGLLNPNQMSGKYSELLRTEKEIHQPIKKIDVEAFMSYMEFKSDMDSIKKKKKKTYTPIEKDELKEEVKKSLSRIEDKRGLELPRGLSKLLIHEFEKHDIKLCRREKVKEIPKTIPSYASSDTPIPSSPPGFGLPIGASFGQHVPKVARPKISDDYKYN